MRMTQEGRWQLAGRISLALLGGYGFTWGAVSLGLAALVAAGVGFHDAETAVFVSGFLLYLWVFLWVFATVSLTRVARILLGGGAFMTLAAWLVQQQVLA